jgi:phosphoglycolate phosphatase-like HAD superfamily hydrolase
MVVVGGGLITSRGTAGIRRGLITRNSERVMQDVVQRIGHPFDMQLSREFAPCKPHPAPLQFMLKSWGIHPHEAIMLGDRPEDMLCGRAAGTWTVLIGEHAPDDLATWKDLYHVHIRDFSEVVTIFDRFPPIEGHRR